MMQINIKRCLSLILAMVLTFSLLPVSALAEEAAETIAIETTSLTEATETPTEAPVETTVPVTEVTVPETTAPAVVVEETAPVVAAASSNKDTVQAAMDAIVSKYLDLTKVLTAEDAAQAVADMDEDTWFEALLEVEDLENSDAVQALTEEDLQELTEKNPLFCAFAEAVYERASVPDEGNTYATTVSVLDGKITITDTANSISASGNTVTVTASGGYFSQTTNTITITNASGADGTLSFTYSPSNYGEFSASFNETHSSGSTYDYSGDISAGGTLSMSIEGKKAWSNNTATLTLNFISMAGAGEAYDVTFEYDSSLGTISVGEVASPTSGYKVEDISASTGIELTATASNSTFLGWVNETTHERLSTATSYTLKPSADCTVRAAFASKTSDAWFLVDNKYLTDDLNTATTLGTKIVLIYDGILPDGNYTIPSGDTLLLPYNDSHTLHTTTPATSDAFTAASAYRTLTMASGANISVEGAISLSGTQSAAFGYNGAPTGAVGVIKMKDGSSITVKNGGNLYAWGYIYSETKDSTKATVTVESGGTVYEDFQFTDWRGGDATSKMQNNEQRVFPMSQYYVQNIRVPLILQSGASEKGYTSVDVSIVGIQSSSVPFIGNTGSGSMFILTSGSLTKDYQESKDRLVVTVEGDIQLSSYSITLQGVTIDSANYVLPITNNLTAHIKSGTLSVTQDIALLPGSEIIIDEGAICKLVKTGSIDTNFYVYDLDEWGKYCGSSNSVWKISQDKFNRQYTRVDADLKDAVIQIDGTLDASDGYIYTTSSAANIHSTKNGVAILPLVGTKTVTYQGTQYSEKGWIGTSYYVEYDTGTIGITPAQLKNGDGTYLATGDEGQGAGTYYYNATHQKWVKDGHTDESTNIVDATCTTDGYTKHTCKCGFEYTTDPITALGHSFTWEIKAGDEATLTAPATETGTCSACGSTDTRNPNSASIGDQEYLTLQAALDNAGELAIVTLQTNISGDIIISQPVIIAFEGNTAAITAGSGYRIPESEETNESITIRRNPRVVSTNIALNEGLDLYFYVKASDIGPDTGDYVAVVSKDFADDREDNPVVEKYSSGGWEAYPSKEDLQYYRFGFSDISAKEMTDLVTVTIQDTSGNTVISDKDGSAIESVYTQTIQNYVVTMLNHYEGATDTKTVLLRTALMDMLEYGAEAQVKFNYNTGNPANVEETGTLTKYSPSTDNPTSTVAKNWSKVAGVTISAKNKLLYTFYFNITNPDGFYAIVTYTHRNGESVNERIEAEDFYKRSEGLYGVDVPYLYIADGFVALNCELYDSSNTKIAYGTDSIAGYAERNQGTSDVYMAMMRFVNSAITYFDYKEPTT